MHHASERVPAESVHKTQKRPHQISPMRPLSALFAYSRARAGVMPMRHARRKCPLFARKPVRASPAILLEVVGDAHLRPGEGRDRREPDGHLQVGLLLSLRQLDHLRYVEGR